MYLIRERKVADNVPMITDPALRVALPAREFSFEKKGVTWAVGTLLSLPQVVSHGFSNAKIWEIEIYCEYGEGPQKIYKIDFKERKRSCEKEEIIKVPKKLEMEVYLSGYGLS